MCALFSLKIQTPGKVVDVNAELYANKNQSNILRTQTSPHHITPQPGPSSRGWLGPVCFIILVKKEDEQLPSEFSQHKKGNRTLKPTNFSLSPTKVTFSPNYSDDHFNPPFHCGCENWLLSRMLKSTCPRHSSLPVSRSQQAHITIEFLDMGTMSGEGDLAFCGVTNRPALSFSKVNAYH